ncbi:hypothetical protein CHS0354_035785 [Potamilus streckersoni]|uniref:RING-type E3 ubiquitin transferase n=1 Tax=Potamilus streckersoni TaxID=2493646 RepID=A0AAE0W438_9BIVA|nr:hypothetical protein CHS0354_035785 [Potamilus streckersoni]
MAEGLRVVRGPDWSLGNADGGEGHVGTVIQDLGNGTAYVLWDMGTQSTCKTGKDGKFDLYILDSAPLSIKHVGVMCDECQTDNFTGARWKCSFCENYDLCTLCYFGDKHELQHPFMRISTLEDQGPTMKKRSISSRSRALGIYPGATVIRGKHWKYGTQDDTTGLSQQAATSTPTSSSSTATFITSSQIGFKERDTICMELLKSELQEFQSGYRGWGMSIAEFIGQQGKVKTIKTNGDFALDSFNDEQRLNSQAFRKVPTLQVGDIVQIVHDEEKVKAMQKIHGGLSADLKAALGKCGKIVKIDSDGDVAVAMGSIAFVFNPACCIPAPGSKPDNIGQSSGNALSDDDLASSTVDDEKKEDETEEKTDLGDLFSRLVAQMLLSDQRGFFSATPDQLVIAASRGDALQVQKIIKQQPSLVNEKLRGITALIIASHEGHKDVVDVLLKANADKEIRDGKGNTALMAALVGKEEEIALLLIRSGANIAVVNIERRTTVHAAAINCTNTALKELLQRKCDPNAKDAWGDTPLHDAITAKNNSGVSILITHPQINPKISNNKGHCPIHLAAMKDDELSLSLILNKFPTLKDIQKKDGYAPLHLAALNNNISAAKALIKANAFINHVNGGKLTPLHLACHQGFLDMGKLLVENGAAIDSEDKDKDTPLHLCMAGSRDGIGGGDLFAALLGIKITSEQEIKDRANLACYLISKGASVACQNDNGKTPLQVCSIEKLRNTVAQFARQHQPAAARTGATLGDLFSILSLPCSLCMENLSNVTFIPCKHKVTCRKCCFKRDDCPICNQTIQDRIDQNGHKLVLLEKPCKVQ